MHGLFHFAYLDAGTGSLIVQSVIGAAAAVGVFGRRVIAKIVRVVFRRGKKTEQPANSVVTKPGVSQPSKPLKPAVTKPKVTKPAKKSK